jgi:hypothetical protein
MLGYLGNYQLGLMKSPLFTFAEDALRANQGQAIKGRVPSYYTQKWLWSRNEKF